jgi:FO synthase
MCCSTILLPELARAQSSLIARRFRGESTPVRSQLEDDEALALAEVAAPALPALLARAAAVRDRAWGRRLTFSPKVFLPLTNLCRNRCDYCSFRRSPGDAGAWTMSPAEVGSWLGRAEREGCAEALFCLGDKPETAFSAYREELKGFGQESTVEYLFHGGEMALTHGLLPHTNAGILTREDMIRLRPVNVSLGLMLETSSARLCQPGMPHHRAPDKRPERRIRMIDEAGQLAIPFTTGILIGIGETRRERVESLLEIRRLHRAHGHVQEVIVQSFRARPDIVMANAPEPTRDELAHAVALARLILDDEVSVQAPPNLSEADDVALLVGAGINDFGGISPVSPDYINPRHPWPHVDALAASCAALGFSLGPRLPVYERWLELPGFVDPALHGAVERTRARLADQRRWSAAS